ncbi:hypothetical protein BG011_001004 [Mortierella polycephala]|uniref:Uncharacterized protein n=1 Tax=Mortierella polycephala TaxID=41804 RepID=A0A9P6QA23_9FUNG|nr:hypothetical protein BG011_001004 [Mortierella polycephala]
MLESKENDGVRYKRLKVSVVTKYARENEKENPENANALPHLKAVQFDDEVQVFEYLRSDSTSEDSSPRPQFENNVEGSDAIVSPSWKSFKVFGLERMGPVLDLSALPSPPDIGRQQLSLLLDSSHLDMDIATPVLTYDTVPPHLLPPLPPLLQSPSELTAPAKINTSSLPLLALPPHADAMQEQKQQQQNNPSTLKIPSSYPAPASSLQLQPLLKYVCLTLIVSASLISFSTLLFGHQHHLHKAFHAFSHDIVIDQDYPAVRHRQYLQGRLFEVDMEFDHIYPILQQVMAAMHSSFGSVFERLQHLEQRMTVRDLWTGYRLGGRTWS